MYIDKEFIDRINEITNFHDVFASCRCVDAIRSGEDKDITRAKIALARHDSCFAMRDSIFDAVYAWIAREKQLANKAIQPDA